MSTEANEDAGDADAPRWKRAAIIRRIDGAEELDDSQQDAVAAAVRNPNAGSGMIADHLGVSESTVRNAVWKLKVGGYDADDADPIPELMVGTAKFKERTLKQRASIHFHAKHPKVFDDLTYEQAAERCAAETGVPLHWSTLRGVQNDFPGLIARRRERLDDDVVERFGESETHQGEMRPVRVMLDEAGITDLPAENLGGLKSIRQAHEEGWKQGVEKAHNGESADTDTDAGDESGDSGEDSPDEPVEQNAGNVRYQGPETGVDLTSGREVSYLVDRAADDVGDDSVRDAIEAIQDENGVFGEHAYQRDIDIDGPEDLEQEVRHLRTIIATQGALIKSLKQALDSLTVDVSVSLDDESLRSDGE